MIIANKDIVIIVNIALQYLNDAQYPACVLRVTTLKN